MFVPILPLFNENYTYKYGFEINASDYFTKPAYEYYPDKMCDGNNNTAWANATFKKAYAKFQFPNEYIPQKISITSSVDASKAPKSFRLYGVSSETLDLQNTFGLKQKDEEPAWIGCSLLLDVKNEGWKEQEKKEWTFKNNKKFKALILYMYEKQGAWNGSSEYSISEFQCYEQLEREYSLIKRSSDDRHVAITKKVKNQFGGFSSTDINEKRSRFILPSSNRVVPIVDTFRSYPGNLGYLLFGDEYYNGKLYMEFTLNGYNNEFTIGLVSKYTDNYGALGVNNLLLHFSGIYLYFQGAERIGERTILSQSITALQRVGLAMDLDNGIFEVIVDGKSYGKMKVRELPKPVIPIVNSASTQSSEVELHTETKFMPKGFKNIVTKKEYEYIVAELTENVSVNDYTKYGMQKGQKIEFDKPYSKEFVWSNKEESLAEGKVFSYKFKAKENVQKIKLDEV